MVKVKDLIKEKPEIKTFAIKQAFKMLKENRCKIPMILDVAREMICDTLLLCDVFYAAGNLDVTLDSRMYRIDTLEGEEVSKCSTSECFEVQVEIQIILMRHNPIDVVFVLSKGLDKIELLRYSLLTFNDSLHLECFEDFLEIRKEVEKELDLLI